MEYSVPLQRRESVGSDENESRQRVLNIRAVVLDVKIESPDISILTVAPDDFEGDDRNTICLGDEMFANRSYAAAEVSIVHQALQFEQHDAARMALIALHETALTVVIDLTAAVDATTSAFAHLIVLRRWLLERGRDLRIVGLRARAERVFKVNRLSNVLPNT